MRPATAREVRAPGGSASHELEDLAVGAEGDRRDNAALCCRMPVADRSFRARHGEIGRRRICRRDRRCREIGDRRDRAVYQGTDRAADAGAREWSCR